MNRLGGLSISNTQTNVTASGRALSVEGCECGEGYTGSSCEVCRLFFPTDFKPNLLNLFLLIRTF